MAAHLLEPPVIGAILADEDRIDRRLHVVVYPPGACSAEERERLVVGVEHHLLRFARIGPHKRHPAVAQAHMCNLHRRGDAIDQDNLVAPVELIGFARIEAQRHIGSGGSFPGRLRPTRRIAPHRIIAAVITSVA